MLNCELIASTVKAPFAATSSADTFVLEDLAHRLLLGHDLLTQQTLGSMSISPVGSNATECLELGDNMSS